MKRKKLITLTFLTACIFTLFCGSKAAGAKTTESLSNSSVQVGKNITMQLKHTTAETPNKSTWQWKSSDTKIASVNKYGIVTGKAKGKVTISLKLSGEKEEITATVRVVSYFRTKSIKVENKPKNAMAAGEKIKLQASVKPARARYKKVIWTSSNKKIATISQKGLLRAKKKGTVTITACVKGTTKSTSFKLKIKNRVKLKKITLEGKDSEYVGGQIALTAALTPKNTTDDTFVWTSNKPEVATVNENGLVTAHKSGKVTITLREKTSKKKAKFHIKVEDIPYSSIEFAKNNPVSLEVGAHHTMQLVTAPSNATDHRIKWSSSNKSAVSVDENGIVTALRPIESVDITAVCKANPSLNCTWNFKITRKKGYITKQTLDNLDLTAIKNVMITAHPDDETLWGGGHLLEGEYLVVCMTHNWNEKRKTAFEQTMRTTNDKYLILDYPDVRKSLGNGKYETDLLTTCKTAMKEDINQILTYKKWNLVVTHNPFGEYGKFLHQQISKMVTESFNKNADKTSTLYYFGRYYKPGSIPGNKLSSDILAIKNSMVNRYYPTAKGAIVAFGHMIPYENWLLPSEW